jgi:hypothetical protein
MFANRAGRRKSKSREKKGKKIQSARDGARSRRFSAPLLRRKRPKQRSFFPIAKSQGSFHLLQIDASDLCPFKIQLWQQILQNGQNQ